MNGSVKVSRKELHYLRVTSREARSFLVEGRYVQCLQTLRELDDSLLNIYKFGHL